MANKKRKPTENVNLPTEYVDKVRKNKETTGVPISTFICQAIDEKLNKQ